MSGFMIEPLSKHTTYVGFYLPKFLECVLNVLRNKKAGETESRMTFYLIVLMCGVIGLTHSRGHYAKKTRKEVTSTLMTK